MPSGELHLKRRIDDATTTTSSCIHPITCSEEHAENLKKLSSSKTWAFPVRSTPDCSIGLVPSRTWASPRSQYKTMKKSPPQFSNDTAATQKNIKSGMVLHIHGNSNVVNVTKRATPKATSKTIRRSHRHSDNDCDDDNKLKSTAIQIAGSIFERIATCCTGTAVMTV